MEQVIKAIKHRATDAAMALTRASGLTAVPIYMYHAVDSEESDLCVAPAAFRAQMDWLKEHGFRTISLDEYARALASENWNGVGRAVVLTFDDGYVNNFENALPALQAHGFTATFFIPTGHVGGTTGWLEKKWPVMTWEQIAACEQAGITIGAHTVTHPHLEQLPATEARREMWQSKQEIEERLGHGVDWLCYPYGGFNTSVEESAREIGFTGALTVMQGNWNAPHELFRLRRFYVGPWTDLRHFALATSRLWSWKHGGGESFAAS